MKKNIKQSDYKSPLTVSFLEAKRGDLAYLPQENYISLRDIDLELPLKVGEIREGLKKMVIFKRDCRSYLLGLEDSPHEYKTERLINLFKSLNFKNASLEDFTYYYTTTDVERAYEMGKLLEHFLEVKRHIGLIKAYKIKSTSPQLNDSPMVSDDNPKGIVSHCIDYLREHEKHLTERGSSPIKDGIIQRGCFCLKNLVESRTIVRPPLRKALLDYKIETFELLKKSLNKPGLSPVSHFFENLETKRKFHYHSFKRLWLLEEYQIRNRVLQFQEDYNLFQKRGPYTHYLKEPVVGGLHGTLEFAFFIFEAHLLAKDSNMNRKEFLDLFCFYASRKVGVRFRLIDKLIAETILSKKERHYLPGINIMVVDGVKYNITNVYQKIAFGIMLAEKEKGVNWMPLKSLLVGNLHGIDTQIMSKDYLTRETVNGVKQKSKLWELVVEEKKVGRATFVRLVA